MGDKINLFDRKKKTEEEKVAEKQKDSVEGFDFAEQMRINKEKAERMKKEKEKANKGVIRSYRLKH